LGSGGKRERGERAGGKGGSVEEYGNAKLRLDAFGKGDEILARSTGGMDYMTLSVLVVSPRYQRRGIGAMLFEDGLKIADAAGFQLVLGASDQGVGLYKKYGRVEVEIMHLDLREYEGGEGLGVTTKVFLHRPGLSSESTKNLHQKNLQSE
jgi:ribosomal protein S18 acetylase RimI-like enzyme